MPVPTWTVSCHYPFVLLSPGWQVDYCSTPRNYYSLGAFYWWRHTAIEQLISYSSRVLNKLCPLEEQMLIHLLAFHLLLTLPTHKKQPSFFFFFSTWRALGPQGGYRRSASAVRGDRILLIADCQFLFIDPVHNNNNNNTIGTII